MKLLKRTISLILSISLIWCFPFAINGESNLIPENGAFVFSSEEMLSYLSGENNLSVSYDTDENALKLVSNGGIDPRVLLDISKVSPTLCADDFDTLLFIYKVPASVSSSVHSAEFFISAGNITVPTANYSKLFTLSKSDSFTSTAIDLSSLSWWKGDIHSIRIDPFTSAQNGDTMYIDSIILCKDAAEADAIRNERMEDINKIVIPNYTNSDYICTSYQYDKYTSPLWKGNMVYNEAVYPVKDKNGNSVYKLMYTPDEITSVYSSDFSSYYYEGIDYTVNGNEITFLQSGSIRLKDYYYIHPQSNPNGYSWDRYYNRTAAGDGKWEYWGQSAEFFNGYINVSYTHSDTWEHHIPEQHSSSLPNTASTISEGGQMNVVFLGDSICGGANSSSYRDVYPYAEYWNEMIVSKLTKDYGCDINVTYSAKGGGAAPDLVDRVDEWVTAYAPDLVFIEFGVNDGMNWSQDSSGSASALKSEFKSAIIEMIEEVRDTYPECEFVLVAPFYANIYCHYMSYFEACRDALNEISKLYSGICVADITAMHESLLDFKDYLDFSGDNMCHPNDFMARLYAQVCLEAIVPGGIDAYTVSEEPPVQEPETGKTSYASPGGYGWQWPTAEAYGYLGNYGTNGQDIDLTFDLALISSDAEEAMAKLYTAEGGDIAITPTGVNIGGRTSAYNWGDADISNWHTVRIVIKDGTGWVYIDGELIARRYDSLVVHTEYQLLFSYLGCMAIDNISMCDSTGRRYFSCDFENEAEAQTLMGEGLGKRTLLAANTVSYDANGSDTYIPNQIKVMGKEMILISEIPEREGYIFLGWDRDKDSTSAEFPVGTQCIYNEDTSVTLYAVWQREKEIISGDINADGYVDAVDLNMMIRAIAGVTSITPSSDTFYAADINSDAVIDAKDLSAILRIIAGA